MTKRTLPVLLLAAVLAAACASTASAGSRPDDPVSRSVPRRSGGPATPRPKIVTPRPGLRDVVPTSWIKAASIRPRDAHGLVLGLPLPRRRPPPRARDPRPRGYHPLPGTAAGADALCLSRHRHAGV